MTKLIVYLLDGVALAASMLMGIFGAAGLCAAVWGPSGLERALGNPPQRAHPAFVLFMAVMVPGMLVGACGALTAIILPLHMLFRVGFLKTDRTELKFLRAYATRFIDFTKPDA
ncbi:MAG: hypothetical protein ABSH34_08785 [Verrucomicrobiota bacterium]